jgi:hypothetical protein
MSDQTYPVTVFPWWKRIFMSCDALNRAYADDHAEVMRGWEYGIKLKSIGDLPLCNPYYLYGDPRPLRERQFDFGKRDGFAGLPPFPPPDRLISKGL